MQNYLIITTLQKKTKSVGRVLVTYLDNLLGGLCLQAPPISKPIKELLKEAASHLQGGFRRIFMAKTEKALGKGGQRRAEQELDWNRTTIRKGKRELESGQVQEDNFSTRGRKKAEEHLPNLLEDLQAIVKPSSQADPTFRTNQLYTPLTAKFVHECLIKQKGYTTELPSIRTVSTKLDQLNYHPQKVTKSKPIKKIKETDAIFKQVHKVNKQADETKGVLRLSMDAKAKVKIGPFSRGGKSRRGEKGADHDFEPEEVLTPWGIFLPAFDESFLYFSKSNVTADFMIDALEDLWTELKQRFNPNTLVLNLDNGPENNSHRTQFIKRIVTFAHRYLVNIRLAYYPPYHSKYNPIERLWGILENHWNGDILDSVDKALGLASTMTWSGIHPVVKLIDTQYDTGIILNKKVMATYESMIKRLPGLEKYFVDIPVTDSSILG